MSGIGFIKRLLGSHVDVEHQQTSLGALVLVVDDSPTICAVLGKMLGRDGYQVVKATDGSSAIEMARRLRPALIFLDVVMPGMNGFSVLRKLRHDPLTSNVPIIMISGNPQATEQFYLQRCGADDFMKKPFGRDEVCERIGQLVDCGRLPARDASVGVVQEDPSLPVDVLDLVPDVAMPDPGPHVAEHLPASGALPETTQVAA